MINFFANIFGYVLNIIYDLIKNYGFAIILFSVLLKLLLLPLTIKQQKTFKKTQKIQGEPKTIQEKYKNDPEKLNKETMALYKRENMSPFSGCLSSIIQLVLLISMFYLVRNPLTYMKKINKEEVDSYKEKIALELGENSVSAAYPEISIVKYINNKIDGKEEKVIINNESTEDNQEENVEQIEENNSAEFDKNLYINMDFLGLDLSNIPKENYSDYKVFIIPILYIISSFISIRLTQRSTQVVKKEEKEKEIENKEENVSAEDMSNQMTKSMTWMMPVLAVSVSVIAPLGLSLYWLVNNVLLIIERIVIDKFIIPKEEEENG